jgi:hypothetical protein
MLLAFAIPAFAQTLHVQSIRRATVAEERSRAGQIITGTVDNRVYTLGTLFGVGVQVGQDYPVVKSNAMIMTIEIPSRNKKHPEKTEKMMYHIVGVEEVSKGGQQ